MHIKIDPDHEKRVHQELEDVGFTSYGFMKGEARHLPLLIEEDEHIGGVVYGRYEGGSAMLVATDKRVLFLDHKPFFRMSDEISYEMVGGVSLNKQGQYATVVLHTRMGNYIIRFVNIRLANRFVHYIETKQIQKDEEEAIHQPEPNVEESSTPTELSQDAKIFLETHELGVLSTIDREGGVHGAVVYYAMDKNNFIYIVTKAGTHKAQNILVYHQVAFTVYDANRLQTLQLSGIAHVETDPQICERIYERILRPRLVDNHAELPPILHLPAGEYMVITITPTTHRFSDFKNNKK